MPFHEEEKDTHIRLNLSEDDLPSSRIVSRLFHVYLQVVISRHINFLTVVRRVRDLTPLRWQLVARTITSGRTVQNNSSLSLSFFFELVGTISLDRNY